jgi:hypothetical protein
MDEQAVTLGIALAVVRHQMAGACVYDAFRILLFSVSYILNLSTSAYLQRTAPAIATDRLVPFLHRFSVSAFHFLIPKCGTRTGMYFCSLKVPRFQFKSLRLNATPLGILVRLYNH